MKFLNREISEEYKDLNLAPIERYVKYKIPCGRFLNAVLKNDLIEASLHADAFNQKRIYLYARFLFVNVPPECWGSREKVDAWLKNE